MTGPFKDVAVLIPAYNPDEKLVQLVKALVSEGLKRIVIVNDGSDSDHNAIFRAFDDLESVTVCVHPQNEGKGAALKTGFRFCRERFATLSGVITADADGQHLPEDICRLAKAALDHPDKILLGSRSFGKGTPLRSQIGNRATSILMSFVHGISLSDTQTGLRYLPSAVLPDLLTLSGNGYEFELQCLIRAKKLGIKTREVTIETVYIDENASSHFLPIVDSVRIYSVLFRFGASSIACFVLDIALFAWIFWLGNSAMFATIYARIISGVVNFFFNKLLVFRSRASGAAAREALGYFALWLALMLVSGSMVTVVAAQPAAIVVGVKILVDISLFLLSYYAQSRFVFARKS